MAQASTTFLPRDSVRTRPRHALIIGVTTYGNGHGLPNCVRDAQAMKESLLLKADFLESNVHMLLNPKLDDIARGVLWLRDEGSAGGLALVYFAGHAVMYEGQHHLLGKKFNGEEAQITGSGFAVDRVIRVLQTYYHTGLVLIDACRNEYPSQVPVRSAGNSNWKLMPSEHLPTETVRSVHSTRGPGGCILIAHACPLYGVAQDGGNLANGTFTSQLLEELFNPAQSVLSAISTANKQVYMVTNGKQDPRIEGRDLALFSTFALADCKGADGQVIADHVPPPSIELPLQQLPVPLQAVGKQRSIQRLPMSQHVPDTESRDQESGVPLAAEKPRPPPDDSLCWQRHRKLVMWAIILVMVAGLALGVGLGVPLGTKSKGGGSSPAPPGSSVSPAPNAPATSPPSPAPIAAPNCTARNCYACQSTPGCVWCFEGQKYPICQAGTDACSRAVKAVTECPVDNIPAAPAAAGNSSTEVTCASLSDCRKCLRFTGEQCRWCVTGNSMPACQGPEGPCSGWYGSSPRECPKDGDPDAVDSRGSCSDLTDCSTCLQYAGAAPQCVWCTTGKGTCMHSGADAATTCQRAGALLNTGPANCSG